MGEQESLAFDTAAEKRPSQPPSHGAEAPKARAQKSAPTSRSAPRSRATAKEMAGRKEVTIRLEQPDGTRIEISQVTTQQLLDAADGGRHE